MRIALVFCLLELSVGLQAIAGPPNAAHVARNKAALIANAQPAVEEPRTPRCAYLGRRGSFHLLGPAGSAAYRLNGNAVIADLTFTEQDANFWTYHSNSGDQNAEFWAFAKQPDCGKSWVYRFSRGRWIEFEATDWWGDPFGGRGTRTVAATTGQELLDKLRDIEGKLNAIQPGARPSLLDLERQIDAKR